MWIILNGVIGAVNLWFWYTTGSVLNGIVGLACVILAIILLFDEGRSY